ncbi:uncharacterized protein [Apostichopus japonicus]|uniref:uncharacterized protein n=1 Tax=Stichopus japonicus TaxID=307972 RepID=UPI003AB7BD30
MSKNTRRGRPRRVLQKEGSPLFAGVMAWFSSSVSQDKKVAWIKHGGTCGNWKEAQFLFSENHNARDTAKLFEQMEFLWGYVTVFHASFISDCVKEKDMKQVAVAPYLILPPEFPLVDIKGIPSGTCETAERDDGSDDDDEVQEQQNLIRHSKRHKRKLDFSQQGSKQSVLSTSEKIHSHSSTSYSTNRTQDLCGSCQKPFQFCNGVEENRKDNDVPLLELESIPHTSTLKKTSQQLSDFVPNRNGCTVSRKF